MVLKSAVVLALVFTSARGHLAWNEGDLQPVQGLYIKPSGDGTTGDLYVAATEENGVSSQWLTDQPVNLLPAASQLQPTALPLFSALSGNALPQEESSIGAQKRSAITGPAAKYAYGLPSYPYTGIQSAKNEVLPATESQAEGAPNTAAAAVPQYSPYHYLYPHMINAAYASALKVLKDAGIGNEDASNNNAISSYPTAYWPGASYYPMQYFMMDPSAWAKSHAAAAQSTSAIPTTTNEPDNEHKSQ